MPRATVPPFGHIPLSQASAPADFLRHPTGAHSIQQPSQPQDDAHSLPLSDGSGSESESEEKGVSEIDHHLPPSQKGHSSFLRQQSSRPFGSTQSLTGSTYPATQLRSGTGPDVDLMRPRSQDAAGQHKLQWTRAMEKSAMRLYVQAVKEGKRSDGGFKSEVHRWVASELSRQYPGFAFDASKCKSKLSQTFKKLHDAFVSCREASSFGWDEARCEVTASDKVWAQFLVSHPHARRFQNQPFPEWYELSIIFGTAATGERSRSIGGRGPAVSRQGPRKRASSEENDSVTSPVNKSHPRKRNRRSTGASLFEDAVDKLIAAILGTTPSTSDGNNKRGTQLAGGSHLLDDDAVCSAVQKFQHGNLAKELPFEEFMAGFSVLENPTKARLFLQIKDSYSKAWLVYQIKMLRRASQ